jgi:hypothetical protein
MVKHEFRTIAQPAQHRSAASAHAGRTPSAIIAGARSYPSFGKYQ